MLLNMITSVFLRDVYLEGDSLHQVIMIVCECILIFSYLKLS